MNQFIDKQLNKYEPEDPIFIDEDRTGTDKEEDMRSSHTIKK